MKLARSQDSYYTHQKVDTGKRVRSTRQFEHLGNSYEIGPIYRGAHLTPPLLLSVNVKSIFPHTYSTVKIHIQHPPHPLPTPVFKPYLKNNLTSNKPKIYRLFRYVTKNKTINASNTACLRLQNIICRHLVWWGLILHFWCIASI